MTDFVRELLEDSNPGDYVRVRYGTGTDQVSVEGTILSVSENWLKLKKQDGLISRIITNDLRALDQLPPPDNVTEVSRTPVSVTSAPASVPVRPVQPVIPSRQVKSESFHVMRQMAGLPPQKSYRFDPAQWIDHLRELLKSCTDTSLKKEMSSVLESLKVALKNRDVSYKYHNLRAKINNLWNSCNSSGGYRIFYLASGILAVMAEDYAYALEPLVRAREYALAAYAASKKDLRDYAEVFSLCSVLAKETGSEISQYTSEICIKRRDAEVLSELLELYKNDQDAVERIASCVYMMYQESGGNLQEDITPYASAFQAAELLLKAIPAEWMNPSTALKRWTEYRDYVYPAPIQNAADVPDVQEGYIADFKMDKKYGFITSPSGDRFFHIKQVTNDTEAGLLLRNALYLEKADQLKVRFRLGFNTNDTTRPSASEVELTKEGIEQARKRLYTTPGENCRLKGFIEYFGSTGEYSYIQSNKKSYKFKASEEYVADPYLLAYLQGSFSPQTQDVLFDAIIDKAFDICWDSPRPEDLDMFKSSVSKGARQKWESRIWNDGKELPDPADQAKDPYEQFYFSPLPEWEETLVSKGQPFSWPNLCLKNSPAVKQPSKTPHPQRVVTTFISGPSSAASVYLEKGRRAVLDGDLSKAEVYFKKEVEINGMAEAVVTALIMLYLRQEGRIDDAVELLEKHGDCIVPDKLLNIKIQVYDKKKDYQALIPLYDQVFRSAASTSKRSHMLVRLIDAQMKLDRYDYALESCTRWESFYQQNRFSSDANKLKNVIPNIDRQKAICYYHMGHIEEAKKIATDLIRSNPADEAANSILNGTLGSTTALEDAALDSYVQDEEDSAFDNEAGGSETLITRFVRNKLQQTDMAASLKSPYLKDGKYTGPSEAALEDVNRLVKRRGVSARTRSESLFAACKLQEQIEQRGDGSIPNPYYKFRLAGRAMASWGDCMVSQVNQLDTARMAYLFSLRVLTPSSRNGTEQDWINSFNRYIKSFFMARVGSNSLEEYINQQTNIRSKDGVNTDIFIDHQIPDVLMPEFLVGMLNLMEALEKQPDRQRELIENLYGKNPSLRKAICRHLASVLERTLTGSESLPVFTSTLRDGQTLLRQQTQQLSQCLMDTGNLLMSMPLSEQTLNGLDQSLWKSFLTATDFSRLGQIYYAVKRAQDYFSNGDFESRAECLRSAISEVKELLRVIQDEPTDVSYDIFLPALEQIHLRLADKQTYLYQNLQPKLSWDETMAPFRTPDGNIQIQLIVKNDLNCQTADTLQIVRATGPEIQWFDQVETVPSLRGGDDAEISLVVQVDESANQSGSFSLTLSYTYKCNDAPQNIILKNQETEFTLVIHDDNFEPLENPFMAYEGKVMDDDSMFFGRSDQISQIVSMLSPNGGEMNYGRAIAMYGQTRTGKSSLMFHLKKRLKETYQDKVVIWDIGNIGELPVRNSDEYTASFLYHMLDTGGEALYDIDGLADILEEEGIEPPLQNILETPAFAVNHFNIYMKKLSKLLRQEGRIIVLMADEFTYLHGYIKEGKISSDFMRFWKALLQNYCVFAIVAGQDDMPEFMREFQNEFACMELLKLTYLGERDAKSLIQEPLERVNHREGLFRRDAMDQLYDLTAGSAYLTIILCSKLVSYLNEKGAYQVTRGIVGDFLRTKVFGPRSFLTEVHFEAQIQERGHREYDAVNKELLLSIARLSQTTGQADLTAVSCTGWTPEEVRRLADRLVDRNVLVKSGRDHYRIQVKLLEKWLISTMGA